MVWVWLLLSLASGVIFLHPYFTYPLSLLMMRRLPINPGSAGGGKSATLVFSAYNESRSVKAKIENLRAIRDVAPSVKFACYVDLSSDDTLKILQREAGDFVTIVAASERTGKAVGMTRLAAMADTELMIFTDANVMLEPTTVPRLLEYFDDETIGGVCGTLIYINEGETSTASTNSAYWRLEEKIKKLESRSGSTMGADGSIFATRRALYPMVPSHLLDDFIVSMSVVFAGRRLVSAPDVMAYERSATASGDEFRRKRRIACRAFSSHRHLWPQIRRMHVLNLYKYISHRLIRWHGALFFGLAVIFGFLFLATMVQIAFPIVISIGFLLLLWAGSRWDIKGVSMIYETLRALWATLLGVYDSWRGKTYQTWQPVESR